MLKIENLNIGYRKPLLKTHFSANLNSPQLIALVGDNGSGKTTMLKTLAGIIPALTGQIYLYGKKIANLSLYQKARITSIVFAHLPSQLNLTVYEILALNSKLIHGEVKKSLIAHTLQLLEIQNLAHKNFNNLSDGQKQKVMFARALVQDTPILLLDEPFAHLDYYNKKLLLDIISHLKKSKLVIFATHDELSILGADIIWSISSKKIIPQNSNKFLSNSHQLKQIYNFYNTHIVNSGKIH